MFLNNRYSVAKKGQMSIEVLIIMAILTIGALVVGTYYFQTINSNLRKPISDDFDGSRAFGIKTPQSVSCGDGTCNGTENCSICPVDCSCPPTGCTVGQLTAVNFSPAGGIYTTPQTVSLSYTGSCPDVNIFYTINEATPTSSSTLYQNPITISNTTTVKAKVFANNNAILGPETIQIYTISAIALCPAGGGDGTPATPKIICTPDDLNAIRDHLDWYYVLGQDIDLNVSPYNAGSGWDPIPQIRKEFNGNNFSIKNLYINRPNTAYIALFTLLSPTDNDDAVIKNLKLIDVNVLGFRTVSALVSSVDPFLSQDAIIQNCSVSGTVRSTGTFGTQGWKVTGGLVATNSGKIYDSNFVGTVFSSLPKTGGLVGENNGVIVNGYTDGNIIGHHSNYESYSGSEIGGIAGSNSNNFLVTGKIYDSHSTANVFGWDAVGGIVGGYGLIDNCYFSGDVNGYSSVGGLIGKEGDINESYSDGYINGYSSVGGLIGWSQRPILNSHFSGDVNGYSSVGGLIGTLVSSSTNILSNNYFNGSVNGVLNVGGIFGEVPMNFGVSTILNCYSKGGVSGDNSVGNFGGRIRAGISIIDCYSTGSVTGKKNTGGFIGEINSSATYPAQRRILNSYSLSNITRKSGSVEESFGGFIGFIDSGDINNCYSIGFVSGSSWYPTDKGFSGTIIPNYYKNFWDIDTSQQTTSPAGAVGKTTAQMKTLTTFSDWNFTNIWAIDISGNINNGYPYLQENQPQ